MALLASSNMRVCARVIPKGTQMTVVRPIVVARNSSADQAMKMAADLLTKGVEAAKNIDTAQLKAQAMAAVNMSATTVKGALDTGLAAWANYDKDADGKLSISEAVALLNGPEISGAIEQATGMKHTKRTEADIQAWFERADFDHSGTLSKREFAVMYAGLLCEKAKGSAGTLSDALLSAVTAATGKDSKIDVSELKNLMGLVGLRGK